MVRIDRQVTPRPLGQWALVGSCCVVLLLLGLPDAASGLTQSTSSTGQRPPDSTSVHRSARSLQSRFERVRLRHLPPTSGGSGGRCDEVIGRLCVWDGGEDGWTPKPEAEAIVEARDRLIGSLDSLATLIPGDPWILGQRVRYRIEAGRFDEAARAAEACELTELWRCAAYQGLALHQAQRFETAERVFEEALSRMPADVHSAWADLDPLMVSDVEDWLQNQSDPDAATAQLWEMADPLYVVPGNDRWTAHLSRLAYAMSSERTRSPHQLTWGKDLAESVVRFGWPIAWERTWLGPGENASSSAVAHDPPAAVRLFPGKEAVQGLRPEDGAEWRPWPLTRKGMQTVYLPPYLDSLAPMDAQVGYFRRPQGGLFVAAGRLSFEGYEAQLQDVDGVLAFSDLDGTGPDAALTQASADVNRGRAVRGAVHVSTASDADALQGVLSLEALFPAWRRAQRARYTVSVPLLPPDVVSVSDLVLLEPGADVASAPDLPSVMRTTLVVGPDDPIGVAFEVYGLGFRTEAVGFRVFVEKQGKGVFSRAVGWLGFGDDEEPTVLAWSEPSPTDPQALFRTAELTFPTLEEGEYDLVVVVQTTGRSEATRRRRFRVVRGTPAVQNPR
ncbi:MAG: hypothetical protein ACR2QM_18360 [Longimicrobiales bacterium]